jgi:hypothetical protein
MAVLVSVAVIQVFIKWAPEKPLPVNLNPTAVEQIR